jgi:hypothetical protein
VPGLTTPFALPTLPALRARLAVAARALEGPSVAGSLGLHVVFGCLLLMMPRPSLDAPDPPPRVVMVDLPPIPIIPPEPPKPPPAKRATPPPLPAMRQSLPEPIARAPQAAPIPQLRLPDPTADALPTPLAPTVTTSELRAPPKLSVPQMPPTPQLTARSEITPQPLPTDLAPLTNVAPTIPDPTNANAATPLRTTGAAPGPLSEVRTPTPSLPDDEPAAQSQTAARSDAKPNPGVTADDERKRAEAEAAARNAAKRAATGGDEPIPTGAGAPPAGSLRGGGGGGPSGGGSPSVSAGGAPAIQGFAIGGLNDGPGDCTDPSNPALTDAQRAACNLRWRGVRGLAPVSGVSGRDRATFEGDMAAKNRSRTSSPATVACKDNLGGDCLPDKR